MTVLGRVSSDEAGATVAELIEAAKELQARHARFYGNDNADLIVWEDADDDAQARMDRALARAGGDAP